MKRNRAPLFRLAALAAVLLLVVVGCSPLPRATPTAGAMITFTPSPSATATEPPATTAPGETVVPGDTVEPGVTPSPTEGATGAPPPTATSTAPAVAATDTSQPTNTPVRPTATPTRVPPTNTPAPPTATPSRTPTATPPAITDWRGEYFDDRGLEPPAVVVRNDRVVDFQWSAGQSPAPGIPSENFSARWSRDWTFETGNYRFQLIVDDGARLWVANNLIIDAWTDGAPREIAATLYLQGQVPIRLEYYNRLGGGRARLNWDRVTSYPDWLGSYYKGRELTGLPYFQRNDPSIDYNWGAGAPRADLPADNFAVRWSRRVNLDRAGTYRFQLAADDGVRFWVDGRLVVDSWTDGYTEHDVSLNLPVGGHDLRLDYYENLGGALVRLTITYIAAPPTSTFTATPTATRQPPTATFTPTATGQPPTATFTPTATGQPPTATFTSTPVPATATFTPTPAPPTSAPPPLQPRITLDPIRGEGGWALQVTGSGWPANTPVDLFLNRIQPEGDVTTGVGQVTTTAEGTFQSRVDLLPLQEMARAQRLEIIARTVDGAYEARAAVSILGQVPTAQVVTPPPGGGGMGGARAVPFAPIPAAAERFAVGQSTYLVLDSAEAWAQHFGAEPPPADPPVDWEDEYVVGAFLGAQPPGVEATVGSVMARDGAIVVQLSSAVPGAPAEGQANLPRALIRVPRAEVERGTGGADEPSFSFVDAGGALLAQGTPGAEPLAAAMALRAAPAPAEPGALALPAPEEGATPEAQAEAAKEAPAEGFAIQPTAEPTAEAGAMEAQAALRTAALGWLVLVVWALVIAALIAGLWLLVRRMRRG